MASATIAGEMLSGGIAVVQEATAPGDRLVNLGVYRYRVGEFTVTAIQDGGFAGPPLERVVTKAALSDVRAALSAAFQPNDRFPITFTTLIVGTGQHIVAIDAGAAGFFGPSCAVAQFADGSLTVWSHAQACIRRAPRCRGWSACRRAASAASIWKAPVAAAITAQTTRQPMRH